jgi:hypothetical protein
MTSLYEKGGFLKVCSLYRRRKDVDVGGGDEEAEGIRPLHKNAVRRPL